MSLPQGLVDLIFNGAILVMAVLTSSGGDPLKEPHKVPVCYVTCEVFNGAVTCSGKTTDVWCDFVNREVGKSEHNYCGRCGTPAPCPKEH